MSTLDALLKRLVTEFAPDFAGWLLDDDVRTADPLTVELPTTALVADAVFRVVLSDGRVAVLHIEFQGRRSHRPMPERMLDYLTRLSQQVAAPIRSVVLYVEPGAGADDDGRHKVLGPAGETVLSWQYTTIHLWQMTAEELLSLGRRSVLPLAGLAQFHDLESTLPKIVTEIRAEPDEQKQTEMLRQLLALLQDEEIEAMTERLISDLDVEELKRFPVLWEQHQEYYQQARTEGVVQGIRQSKREDILFILEKRFNPKIADYRRVERALANVTDVNRLNAFLERAWQVVDLEEFERDLDAQ